LPSHPYALKDLEQKAWIAKKFFPFSKKEIYKRAKKEMALSQDMNKIVNNILHSYEARIKTIGSIFDTTHQILQGFQDALLDTRQEREKIRVELRESLAKNGSLRRKDFDNMMQSILLTQEEREKEVRNLLNQYLNEQREMAKALRENLERVKDSLAKGKAQRLKGFQEMIKEILAKQDKRKEEVTSRLKEFQNEQKVLSARLKELLAKGKELRIKDFKSMLREFKTQHKERITRQQERREMVLNMLGGFKKERVEAAKNWRLGQKKRTQRRNNSPKAIHSVRDKDF